MRAILFVGTVMMCLAALMPVSVADHGDAAVVTALDGSSQIVAQYSSGGGCTQTWAFKVLVGTSLKQGNMKGCWEGGFSGTLAGTSIAIAGTGVLVPYCGGSPVPNNVIVADTTVTIGGVSHAAKEVVADALCA